MTNPSAMIATVDRSNSIERMRTQKKRDKSYKDHISHSIQQKCGHTCHSCASSFRNLWRNVLPLHSDSILRFEAGGSCSATIGRNHSVSTRCFIKHMLFSLASHSRCGLLLTSEPWELLLRLLSPFTHFCNGILHISYTTPSSFFY